MGFVFFITEKKGADDTEGYELRAVMPRNYDKEAFAWAINHLKFQFKVTEEPTFEEWPSNHGAQLLLAEGLLQQLCQKAAPISSTVREKFAVESLATLRSLRTAAVQANNAEVEEVCNENAALHQAFLKLFVPILPAGMRVPTAALPSVEQDVNTVNKRRAPSPKVKTKRPNIIRISSNSSKSDRQERTEEVTETKGESNPTVQQPSTERQPVVREIERNPALPTLKRRRVVLEEKRSEHLEMAISDPVIRDATAEEAEAKRIALSKPDHVEEIEMESEFSTTTQPTGDAEKLERLNTVEIETAAHAREKQLERLKFEHLRAVAKA